MTSVKSPPKPYVSRTQRLQPLPPGRIKREKTELDRRRTFEAWIRKGFLPTEAWLLTNNKILLHPKTKRQRVLVKRLIKVRRTLIATWRGFGFSTREIYNFLYDLVENPIVGETLEDQLKSVGSDPNQPDTSLRPYSALLRSRDDVEANFKDSLELTIFTFGEDSYQLLKEDSEYWEEIAHKILKG